MIDLNKHLEFFNPTKNDHTIHIIGVGAIGSNIAIQLTRLGFQTFMLYDFDIVTDHNITNQAYTQIDVKKPKLEAIERHMLEINPDIVIVKEPKGWEKGTPLSDIVIVAVDSIELRKEIIEDNKDNPNILFLTDLRIGLEEAQCWSANWKDSSRIESILSTMQFKDSEVDVPVSACGTQLSVLPTIQIIVSFSIMNIINFLKNKTYNYLTAINSITGFANSQKSKN